MHTSYIQYIFALMEKEKPTIKKLIDVKRKDIKKLKDKAHEKDIPVKQYIEQLIEKDLNAKQ